MKIKVGDVEVSRVEELHCPAFSARDLFPDWSEEAVMPHLDWLAPAYFAPELGQLVMSSHSWVIRTGRHTILIDTCIGNHKERPESSPFFHRAELPYLANLAAAGVHPHEVDYVLCTHLHTDHVGWNTRLADGRWVPTFPNAKYVFSETERNAFDPLAGGWGATGDGQRIYADSVLPVIETGQALLVNGTERIADVLTIEPLPGHTLGHIGARLTSRDEQAMFVGDAFHHPIQIYYPDWSTPFCDDGVLAAQTRRRILEEAAETNLLLCPAHFAAPHCGCVRRQGSAYSFVPGPSVDRVRRA